MDILLIVCCHLIIGPTLTNNSFHEKIFLVHHVDDNMPSKRCHRESPRQACKEAAEGQLQGDLLVLP